MDWFLKRAGGRKVTGFFACLAVGGVLIYVGRLDSVAAAFLAALYTAYVGGNAATHLAQAVSGFRNLKGETAPSAEGASDGR